ncbi:MAG: hypothetical protein RPU52_01230 [Candidatus Sedimenticola sp. (ex Thyasira tokunagai)]
MTDLNSNIRKKAYGIMKSIEVMNEKERMQRPSESFGVNYNKLRAICLRNNPDLEELLPPEVKIENYGFDGATDKLTEHNFSEIHTFCSEINQLLE